MRLYVHNLCYVVGYMWFISDYYYFFRSESSPQIPGLQISVGGGFTLGGAAGTGNSPITSLSSVLTTSAVGTGQGIQITIPALPASGISVPEEEVSPTASVTKSPNQSPSTQLTAGVRPSFGVPVPVITSVHALQNKPQGPTSLTSSVKPLPSQLSINNQVDEDYDS